MLVPGDVVVLEAGDTVPADARVVEAHELTVELATLTGESQPVARTTDPVAAGTAAQDARNCVFMGTARADGTPPRPRWGRSALLTARPSGDHGPVAGGRTSGRTGARRTHASERR